MTPSLTCCGGILSQSSLKHCISSWRFSSSCSLSIGSDPLKHLDSFLFQTFSCRFAAGDHCPEVALHIMIKHLHFLSVIHPKTEVWLFCSDTILPSLTRVAMFFLERRSFRLVVLPNQPYLFSFNLIALS